MVMYEEVSYKGRIIGCVFVPTRVYMSPYSSSVNYMAERGLVGPVLWVEKDPQGWGSWVYADINPCFL